MIPAHKMASEGEIVRSSVRRLALMIAMCLAGAAFAAPQNPPEKSSPPQGSNPTSATVYTPGGTSPLMGGIVGSCYRPAPGDPPDRLPGPLPDHVVYCLFFEHVLTSDREAMSQESRGYDNPAMLQRDQRAANLNDDEGNILKQVAYDWDLEMKKVDAKVTAARKEFQSRYPPRLFPGLAPPGLEQFEKEKEMATNNSIYQLRSGLGEASFAKLDQYVRTNFLPPVHAAVVPGVGVSVKARKQPQQTSRPSSPPADHP